MSRSASAFPVVLELHEVEALIDWHDDAKESAAMREDYGEAERHQRRTMELAEALKDRRTELTADLERRRLAVSNGKR